MQDEGIFTNKEEALETIRESAKAIGVNPDIVAPKEPKVRYMAKKNCKKCFGLGVLKIVPSPQKTKEFRAPVVVKKQKDGPTPKTEFALLGRSPETKELRDFWNTSVTEPREYKVVAAKQYFCSCVKKETY